MVRLYSLLAAIAALVTFSFPALAEPGDIDAAARGVVRVVIIDSNGDGRPLSHGSGFAVTPTRVVTNAHVIREVLQDDTLRIAIVPSEAGSNRNLRAAASPVAVSPRNDLALLEINDGSLRLPPLTLAGGANGNMGEVSAVGYPMNVDNAQGLEIHDIFRAQPPVKSRGFLSGERPARQFDSILHTAPVARGNSGGPLLDGCGRVLGVNSFGAETSNSEAEFFFAVSLRELLPFLRENGVDPAVNALPCRSIEELNAAERARFDAERAEAQAALAAHEAEMREARDSARLQAQIEIMEARENAMALAMLLLMLTLVAGYIAAQWRASLPDNPDNRNKMIAAATVAGVAFIAAVFVWIARPGFGDLEDRVAQILDEVNGDDDNGEPVDASQEEGTLICTLVPERSRITGARNDDVEFDWRSDGCVNTRTQYGLTNGEWSRVFVPDTEAAVSVNSYDPETRTFRTDRYLLGRSAMEEARAARSEYDPPACGAGNAQMTLGEQQSALLALLPDRPNERLVYSCQSKIGGAAAPLEGGGE